MRANDDKLCASPVLSRSMAAILCCLLAYVPACSNKQDKIVKVDSVRILYASQSEYTLVGTWEFHPSTYGLIKQLPKGPPAVWIFRDVPPEYKNKGVQAGNAYLPDSEGKFRWLCRVDPSLSDADIASPFLKEQLLADRRAADASPELIEMSKLKTQSGTQDFVVILEGEPYWEVEGVLHYHFPTLVERQYWKNPPKTSAAF